eukprot:TRINITY_DN33895_c0_g1_i1.p1 TRINITY_DN33895_c0_g1~~TRINITY_DN33895_c0_g1_i1.p1  ORF type:complete len:431 (+),score=67.69 TRINITY_DN33895_c0_g1_i1:130-1422(+)
MSSDVRQPYDAIVVPGGGGPSDSSDPRTLPHWVIARLDFTAALWHALPEPRPLILTLSCGTPHKADVLDCRGRHLPESVVSTLYLTMYRQIPASFILEEFLANDTIGNILFVRLLHTELRRLRRLLVVTSDFHMPRTKAIAEWIFAAPFTPPLITSGAVATGLEAVSPHNQGANRPDEAREEEPATRTATPRDEAACHGGAEPPPSAAERVHATADVVLGNCLSLPERPADGDRAEESSAGNTGSSGPAPTQGCCGGTAASLAPAPDALEAPGAAGATEQVGANPGTNGGNGREGAVDAAGVDGGALGADDFRVASVADGARWGESPPEPVAVGVAGYALAFLAVEDEGEPDVLAARKAKEAQSLSGLRRTIQSLRSELATSGGGEGPHAVALGDIHTWLFREHAAYAPSARAKQHLSAPPVDPVLAKSY